MIAAILRELNAPLELAEVEPLGPELGQVLVRMLTSGICGSQLAEIRGEKGNADHLPHLLGHEGCGIVEAVGAGVRKVREGDKVVIHWRKGSGIESAFPRYRYRDRTITSGKAVTFAEQVIVSENRVTPVPPEFPADLAALFGCGFSTAMAALEREAEIKAGERVMVIGAGGIGINVLAAAGLKAVGDLCCCDVFENKRALVEGFGSRFVCRTIDKADHGAFDVVIDTVANGTAFSTGMKALAPSGRMIVIGQAPSFLGFENSPAFFAGEGQSIKATQGGGFVPDVDIPRWVRLWERGHLLADKVITHEFPFAAINAALDVVRQGEGGRVLLTFGK